MFKRYNQRRPKRYNSGNYSAFRAPQVRKVKSFDPTSIILNNTNSSETFSDYQVTHTFADLKISEALQKNIAQRGYQNLTPIQDQAIEPILQGKDLIGIANTGTGKTAAFLIPLIELTYKNRSKRTLIITPTRELANQIKDEFLSFGRGLGIFCSLCIGGANIKRQIAELRRYPNFVIGTPGRIQDLIRTKNLDLSNFNSIVLDEADLMVDIGFIKCVKEIVSLLSANRQSLFFSATIDGKVSEILRDFVKDPITVSVKTRETAQNVEQKTIRVIDTSKKIDQLYSLLMQKEFVKVLVFGRTKRGVQKLAEELYKRGVRAEAIHGNKKQSQRLKTLKKFKDNYLQTLIATDVAARGLDIPNVSHVINYDLPESKEAYVHRIGRTGRADKKGFALTFVS